MTDVPARVVFRKWGDRPHWEYDAVWLGDDRHGTWLGVPAGTSIRRPGAAITTGQDQVVLAPQAEGWVATFYADEADPPCAVYVDVATPPVVTREGARLTVTAVDLDLDVLRGMHGRVWVDDEDEFAAHRTSYGYPETTVTDAVSACAAVRAAMESWSAPFDAGTAARWLSRL
ncbi:MAG: DUF402 domain-containing protein [Nocardioides sp.]|nr:DUF402 domain-containing protein [Nocardioides sp.]